MTALMKFPAYSTAVRRLTRLGAMVTVAAALAACQDNGLRSSGRAYAPIPSDVLALMSSKGTNAHQPVLIRAYKKEAELEIWKMKSMTMVCSKN